MLNKSNYKIKNKDLIRIIKNELFTDEMVKASSFYYLIEDRYNSFSYDNISTLSYTDAIINFDASLVPSKLISDYILFEQDKNQEYNHMAIGINKNTNERFLESFFHETTDKYIVNQIIVKVKSYKLIDKNNITVFEDIY